MKKKLAGLDPATHYATEVVARRIIAGRLVRLACARHLDDLARQAEKGLVWQPDDAQEAIDFFPQVLCLPEETDADEDADAAIDVMPETGTPFVLTPFQQFIVGSLFGWFAYVVGKRSGTKRLQQRFRICYFEGAKGCGKTPMGAGILLFLLVRHGVRGAQLFCAAVTKDQAKLAFTDCVKMVHASPALKALITQTGNNLAVLATGSFIRPISSEKRGLDGKRVQGAVVDELQEHPSATIVAKLKAGIKGRPNALLFIPTNSGHDRTSICWEYHEKSRDVLEGTIIDETWFAYVCQLDPCAMHEASGKRAPIEGCPDCDDWQTEGDHWLKANPNLGVSLPWQYLRDQVRDGVQVPSQRNLVMRLNFCLWTDQATVWITQAAWSACKTPLTREAFAESLRGRACYVGIDLSDKIDLTSAQVIFPRARVRATEDGVAPTIEQLGGARVAVDHALDVLSFFWMPNASLVARGKEDGMPYPDWSAQGHLTATAGLMVDHDAVVDFIIWLATRYQIKGIGIDQAGASAVITRLRRHFGDEFVQEIKQGFMRLNTPARMIEALILSLNLVHDGNPVMAMCMGHMAIDENSWREIRPIKISQRKRIDGGVALIDAEASHLEHPGPPDSVYLTRGVRTLGE